MKDIQLVDIDYSGLKPEYKKEDVIDIVDISTPWIVPEEGPFYGKSLRVIKGGIDLIPGTDFKPVTPVTDLTTLTGKDVHLYVELKDHILASGGQVSIVYQRVGLPVISIKTLMDMLEDMVIKGKPVDWETQITGKPDSYWPAWHSHDIQNPNELVGFGGLVELFSYMTWEQRRSGARIAELLKQLQNKVYAELTYIQRLKYGAISGHFRNYNNPHSLAPIDVDLGNVDNFAAATPQQDADGLRGDLLSTPAGLKRVIEERSPDTSGFLMQSELPLGYYGSGMYIPPPITGSFEGLGSDYENSAFCLEGNGWTVGLIRGYDGRVKNLYYVYKTDARERDESYAPWVHTYVAYKHPVISAAGKNPNVVLSGSGDKVFCVGACEDIGNRVNPATDAYWISASNSTFDSNNHNLKPTNITAILNSSPGDSRPAKLTLSKVGDWVYLIQSVDSFDNDLGGNVLTGQSTTNWQQWFWRVPYSDLTDPSKTSITFTRVNVNFDNLDRERRNNSPAMFMIRNRGSANRITQGAFKFSPYANTASEHLGRTFVIVPDPNNKRIARVRIVYASYCVFQNPTTLGNISYWPGVLADYEWDVVSNTWTLSPNYSMPTLDMYTGKWANPTQQQLDWTISEGNISGHSRGWNNVTGSWVTGVGYLSMMGYNIGGPPYGISTSLWNRDGDTSKDFYWMGFAPMYYDAQKQFGNFANKMVLKSPFGVSGFPRFYSDLYSLTSGVRQTPIEIFLADDESQTISTFYRITEGGEGDQYNYRSNIQSNYIPKQIYGRKTNSNFGKVVGIDGHIGMANRPRRKDASSRQVGLFTWGRTNVLKNPGAPYAFSHRTGYDSALTRISPESDGSIIINLDLDYTLDSLAKILYAKANKSKQVRIPRSIYVDMVHQALGVHASTLIDYFVSFYIASQSGTGGDQPYSMWSVNYHVSGSPTKTRTICGLFTWDVDRVGADDIRVLKVANMVYPFTSTINGAILSPANLVTNITNEAHRIGTDLTWDWGFDDPYGLVYPHMEILDFESEGPQNFEQVWYSGELVWYPGDASMPRGIMKRRGNRITEATYGWTQARSADQFTNVIQANPQYGFLTGIPANVSGGAICLMEPVSKDKYIMLGATYVEGNWSIFINANVPAVFNGQAMPAEMTNWDLRDLTDIYKNQIFYLYCTSVNSSAVYEITKTLKGFNPSAILAAKITTDDLGIVTIERYQNVTISGFPITRNRDMGVPASSGAITEQGSYKFLKRSELYNN